MLRRVCLGLLGLAFSTAASAESLGACVWAKAPPELHDAFLTAYHHDTAQSALVLSKNGARLQTLAEDCAPGLKAPKQWVQGAIGAQAIEDGAAHELAASANIDRARLDEAWAHAPKAAADCFNANAAKLYGIQSADCPDARAALQILEPLGIPKTANAGQALSYFAAKAQSGWAEALIAKSRNDQTPKAP